MRLKSPTRIDTNQFLQFIQIRFNSILKCKKKLKLKIILTKIKSPSTNNFFLNLYIKYYQAVSPRMCVQTFALDI